MKTIAYTNYDQQLRDLEAAGEFVVAEKQGFLVFETEQDRANYWMNKPKLTAKEVYFGK